MTSINKINNESGAILLITLTFVLAFTSLGIAAIYFATRQSEFSETLRASTEAFWLADGAIERARSLLPGTLLDSTLAANQNVALPNLVGYPPYPSTRGTYNIGSKIDDTSCGTDSASNPFNCPNRWQIDTSATVIGQIRTIQAFAGRFDITNAATSRGTINGGCSALAPAQLTGNCRSGVNFTFDEIFNGTTYADAVATADFTFNDPNDATLIQARDVTRINLVNDSTITVTTINALGSFLIIDTTAIAAGTPIITFVGSDDFHGIIWVKGNVQFAGNKNIVGALFLDNASNTVTANTINLTFAPADISQAVGELSPVIFPGDVEIVSWKEL